RSPRSRRRPALPPRRRRARRHGRTHPQRPHADLDLDPRRARPCGPRHVARRLSVGTPLREPRTPTDGHHPGRNAMTTLRRRIARQMTKTIATWNLLAEGDHVMVAVSGGKDSYTLLDLLWEARSKAPFRFDLTAVHLDQGQPGYDGAPLRAWLEAFGAPYRIERRDTYSTVVELVPDGKSYCGPCSRMRRGVLYRVAEE